MDQLFKYIKQSQPDENLQQVLDILKDFGLPQNSYIFDPTLVRGCDYYTGTIFEVQVPEANGGVGTKNIYITLDKFSVTTFLSIFGAPNWLNLITTKR